MGVSIALCIKERRLNILAWDEYPQLWFQDGGLPSPSDDQLFKSKLVRMKDCNGKYEKSYLREYKHGATWHAHLENI